MIELAVKYAWSMLHMPYRWGGDDPINGYDCSGLVQEILGAVGIDPEGDQTAAMLSRSFPICYPQAGALSFYGSESVTHVGFCIDQYHMIEAGGGGSKTLTAADAARQNAFVRIRPIKRRNDYLFCTMPPYIPPKIL